VLLGAADVRVAGAADRSVRVSGTQFIQWATTAMHQRGAPANAENTAYLPASECI